MDDLTREFLIESQEGLDRMERCLTELEANPGDTALLAEIFRAVHTIKGTTGFLGFKRLEKLAHAGENLLGLLREGRLAATAPIITGLLELLDGLRSILRIIEAEGHEGKDEDAAAIARLEELQIPVAAAAPAATNGHVTLHRTAANPQPPSPRPLSQHSASPPQAVPPPAPAPAAVPPAAAAHGEAEAETPRTRPPSNSASESTLRVDVALLNRMMNLVGELVLTRNQVLQATASNPNMTMLSRRLDMVTADLREAVMKARMQPVSNIFSKMPRIVRDLSQVLHRKVNLEMEG
ncbi:MAG TPA: Hpt domain-containing protein, partial [Terracidiphilus sp.]|nr:Hpt domain-containing protein [Terracidiphilus sp.]